MSQSRQLAAIMFTDIVGYTALMGNDEQKAFSILKKNRELQKPIIEQFNGRWIKELGDGVMASFSTVSDAVNAAIKIQEACKAVKDFELRIGIHLGEVIFEDDDVFGDGVNIASRIQSAAKPGSIYVSESVHHNVANKKDISTRFIHEEQLKNVKEAVRIYEVIITTTIESPDAIIETKTKILLEKSIAVLPFVNMSNDPEQDYFSDGISEEIINSITHIKDLRVAGRTSSFFFKGKNIDLREVGKNLNVHTVLEGSVRRQGSRLRITAQLIKADDGFHLWSERFDREIDDIFAIQDEIALAITEKLKITLLEKEKVILHKNPTELTEAYDLYLKGRFHLNKRGAGLKKALEYFQQAVEIDSALALAYSGMADVYFILAFYGSIPSNKAIPLARQYAEKAIQIDSSNVEAFTALACIGAFYDWKWTEAKKLFKDIFEINPNYASAHCWYSYYLAFVESQHEKGIKEAGKAAEILEPLESISHHVLSVTYMTAGKFEEALQAAKMSIELDAHSFPGYRALGVSLAGLGRYDEAIEALQKCALLSARHVWPLGELCWVYSLTGNIPEIEKIRDELITRSKNEPVSGLFLSGPAYFSKNYDLAYEFMELAFEQRDCALPFIKNYPPSSYIKNDPRLQPFIERMNFPE